MPLKVANVRQLTLRHYDNLSHDEQDMLNACLEVTYGQLYNGRTKSKK